MFYLPPEFDIDADLNSYLAEEPWGGYDDPSRPSYYKDPYIHKHRRASFHDYRHPFLYHLTFTALPGRPRLCDIFLIDSDQAESYKNSPQFQLRPFLPSRLYYHNSGAAPGLIRDSPGNLIESSWNNMKEASPAEIQDASKEILTRSTPLGSAIREEIYHIRDYHPEMEIFTRAIMPDHIHLLLNVKKELKRDLGQELAGFIMACNRHFQKYNPEFKPPSISDTDKQYSYARATLDSNKYFLSFDDVLIDAAGQLDKAKFYIMDNPYRYAVKKAHPDLFQRYLHLRVGNWEFAAYGNIFLLKKLLHIVRVHRNYSREQFDCAREEALKAAAEGKVLISPFIHPEERGALKEALKQGASAIWIQADGMEERFSAQGRKFRLCAEGRLLLIAPWPGNKRSQEVTWKSAHAMNDLAEALAALPAASRMAMVGLNLR